MATTLPTRKLGASGIGYVVGYSPGGASLDLGSTNLATSLPYVTGAGNAQASFAVRSSATAEDLRAVAKLA